MKFVWFGLVLAMAAPSHGWTLRSASSLQKLTATAPGVLEPFKAEPVQLRAARGEWESFQVIITAGDKPIQKLELSTTGLATIAADSIPSQNLQIYRENYVYVPRPSGNRELRKLWWPDALIPLGNAAPNVPANQSAVYWVSVQIPRDAVAGDYFGELDVRADGEQRRLALHLKVEPVTLPVQTMRATAALYYGTVRDWYAKNLNLTYSNEDWAAQQKRYYDFLLDYGINAYDLPVPWGTEAAAAYLKDDRVRAVRVPPLDTPEFNLALGQLKATGTLKKAYYYHIDEPQPDKFADVRKTTEWLRPLGIRHLVTVHPNETLKDAVDIWCPNIGDFFGIGHLDVKALAEERKKGRETWWYTMVEPKYPYPTWLLDDDAESVRVYGALMARYGITGFVYSMVHGWGPKPLEDLTSFAGTSGDGTLIYPGELVGVAGPIPSIRLMLLRDAIEDYELCGLVREKYGNSFFPWSHDTMLFMLAPPRADIYLHGVTSPREDNFPFRTEPTKASSRLTPNRNSIAAPDIDGILNDKFWEGTELRYANFGRSRISGGRNGHTSARAGIKENTLYVAVHAAQSSANEWIAVDVAPEDIASKPERLRFVANTRGLSTVERQTREGHFRVEVPGFKSAVRVEADYWTAEFAIPLEPLGYGDRIRFNLRRRTADKATGARIVLSAQPDGDDPWNMAVISRPEQ